MAGLERLGPEVYEAARERPPPTVSLPTDGQTKECSWCAGHGYVRRGVGLGHPDFGQGIRCPVCNPLPLMVGVPPLYADSSFENFDLSLNPTMKEAFERCQVVAAGIALCALIVGDYGVGKTHLAVAALRASQWSKPGIYWESVTKFLDHLRQRSYGDGAEDIADVIRPYERGDFLLVLDDLGIEKRTEWSEDRLYQVLDSRYSWRLPTIITTNVDRERIDARIRSRFREGLVVCRGSDVRGRRE